MTAAGRFFAQRDVDEIMSAFWWSIADRGPHDDRRRFTAAIKAATRLWPYMDQDIIRGDVDRLVEMELREDYLLKAYCRYVMHHVGVCIRAIGEVKKASDAFNARTGLTGQQVESIWPRITIVLLNAAAIARWFSPSPKGKRALPLQLERARLLTETLHPPEGFLSAVRKMRDAIEHLDERVTIALAENAAVEDLVIFGLQAVNPTALVLRSFDLHTGKVRILDDEFELFKLQHTMLNIMMTVSNNVMLPNRYSVQRLAIR